jgi:death-on-curing protein
VIFVDVESVVAIHAVLIERFGGTLGLRDEGLLRSALAQPEATFGGTPLHEDVFEMAAAYAYHLCANHPFLDGNKRIAATVMGTFLSVNGVDASFDEALLYEEILAIANGQRTKAQLAGWLRSGAGRRR